MQNSRERAQVNWQHYKRRPAAKTILRNYINATLGFAELAEATNIPSKSLMRMLGPWENPRADNLLEVLRLFQQREGVRFRVKTSPL
jgi:DNA-binding phage protein